MRSQTIVTQLVNERDWRAAPVDPAGWLTGSPARESGPGEDTDRGAARDVPRESRDDRSSAGRTQRRAARARRLRTARARAQRAAVATAELRTADRAELPAPETVIAGRIEVQPKGYRLSRWARLAMTLTALAAVVVVTVSLAGGAAPAAFVDVTVGPGDTLWSIAQSSSPDRDPRAVIDEIRQLNDVPTDNLPIGIVLRVPSSTE